MGHDHRFNATLVLSLASIFKEILAQTLVTIALSVTFKLMFGIGHV